MIAGATTVLSYACLIDFPPLITSLQFSNRPPLRFYSPRTSRVFHQHRNSVPRRLITRVAESVTDGFWEEPDDGFGSEGDESEDEEIEKEQTATSYSGDSNGRHSKCDYEQLVKEVEQLLEPEERDILQQNEVPDISKISTKKWSLFHSLGLSLQISLMDELLERGWDIDSIDQDGYTALHKAVIGKKDAVISHLLRKGANPFIRDRGGTTALHYAVQAGAMQTVKLLIKYKVDVNAADNDGWTPLHISMQSRSRDIAKVLLVNGADKTRRNKLLLKKKKEETVDHSASLNHSVLKQRIVYDVQRRKSYTRSVKVIYSNRTQNGKTPLDLSLCYGRDFKSYDLTKLLKLVPADRNP